MKKVSDDFKREIIIDHYENPINKTKTKKISSKYTKGHKDTPSCIDNIDTYVSIEGNKIKDVKFEGVACAISTSSTDIMASILKGKTIEEAKKIITEYLKMVTGEKKFDDEILGDLIVYNGIHKQFNRINCAKIGIEAILDAINKK